MVKSRALFWDESHVAVKEDKVSLVEQRLESVAEDPEVLGLAPARLQVVHGLAHVDGAEEVVVDEEAARRGEVLSDDVAGGVVEALAVVTLRTYCFC